MEHTRIERDVLGEVDLPENAMYGINTARALENFPLGHKRTAMPLIYAMVTVKKAAALTYARDFRPPGCARRRDLPGHCRCL